MISLYYYNFFFACRMLVVPRWFRWRHRSAPVNGAHPRHLRHPRHPRHPLEHPRHPGRNEWPRPHRSPSVGFGIPFRDQRDLLVGSRIPGILPSIAGGTNRSRPRRFFSVFICRKKKTKQNMKNGPFFFLVLSGILSGIPGIRRSAPDGGTDFFLFFYFFGFISSLVNKKKGLITENPRHLFENPQHPRENPQHLVSRGRNGRSSSWFSTSIRVSVEIFQELMNNECNYFHYQSDRFIQEISIIQPTVLAYPINIQQLKVSEKSRVFLFFFFT